MNLRQLKLEFFQIRKAFFVYRAGWRYLWTKFVIAPRIRHLPGPFEKPVTQPRLSVHMLTCHRDITIMLWSLQSYYSVATVIGQLFIHNDGSLTAGDKQLLNKFFPGAQLINAATFPQDFEPELKIFPALRRFRVEQTKHFSFKKLIDPLVASSAPMHMILDSDILWFRQPIELEAEIHLGCQHSLMQDNRVLIPASYRDGTNIPEIYQRFNAGIILYRVENFDVSALVTHLQKLDPGNERNFHFADQTGHAVALKHLLPLPPTYQIHDQVGSATVARHYTSPRRVKLYTEGLALIAAKLNK